jgi:acetoin utilization protein AcuB
MFAGDCMSRPVITIHKEMPIQEALNLMVRERIRRLPVIDRHANLIGIVSERDLLHAAPSDATSLSIWELNYLISKITVEEIMTREVITVQEQIPIEEVARIMVDRKIGGLPVLRDGRVVGIITETDLLKVLSELLGAGDPGIRLTARIANSLERQAGLSRAIFEIGGRILALGTIPSESPETSEILMKIEGIPTHQLRVEVEHWVEEIIDISEPE